MHSTSSSTPRRTTRATRTVVLKSVHDGWIDLHGDHGPRRSLHLPAAIWAGTGGYWQEAQLTPELLEANGLGPLAAPTMGAHDLAQHGPVNLSDLPSNRWRD